MASAHRSAAILYILGAVASTPSLRDVDADAVRLDIFHHLSSIQIDDNLFKATAWPTFVAGAETDDLVQRTWVSKRLGKLWEALPWGYVRSAIDTLEEIWTVRDSLRLTTGIRSSPFHQPRSLGFRCLVV